MKEWNEFFKTLPSLFIIGILVLISIFGYREWKSTQTTLSQKDTEYKEKISKLEKNISDLKNGYKASGISEVDKKELLENTSKEVRDILEKYGFRPVGSTKVGGRVPGGTYHSPTNTKNTKQYVEWPEDEEGNRIKLGYVDGEIVRVYGLKFDVDVTIVEDEAGNKEAVAGITVTYGDTANEVAGDTTEYHVEVTNVDVKEEKPESDIRWRFAPHIDGGVSAKVNQDPQIGGGAGVSFFAYGETKDDNIFRIPRVGVAGNQDEVWVEVGGQYNVGKNIPMFSDLWITGSVCYDSYGQPALCIGVDSTF